MFIPHFTNGEIEAQRPHRLEIQASSCPYPNFRASSKLPHASVGPCHIFLLLPPNLTGVAECRLVVWGWRDIGTTVLLSY